MSEFVNRFRFSFLLLIILICGNNCWSQNSSTTNDSRLRIFHCAIWNVHTCPFKKVDLISDQKYLDLVAEGFKSCGSCFKAEKLALKADSSDCRSTNTTFVSQMIYEDAASYCFERINKKYFGYTQTILDAQDRLDECEKKCDPSDSFTYGTGCRVDIAFCKLQEMLSFK